MGEMADLAEDMALKEEYLDTVNCENYQQKTNQELVEIIEAYVEDDWLTNDDFLVKLRDWFQQKKYFTTKQRQAVIEHLARLPELD
ncbi:hypothetical protein ANSO36C_64430 (plasmid) [Nostoc cf. commune SO-36]|uniref:Uncharacterized protein n=1 Tax=Nostoc cf. commune SO-36 TaxID=449208 RepID=A0ABM7ZBH5_NOSCO|nr:hypothetical protein [Nostoc commune]BDI20641.1 hypothetical protein ANSO36C_64430 [Nostoc cf. commune SO-36]